MSLNFDEFKKIVFEQAKKLGFSDYELYYENSEALNIGISEGNIEEFINTNLNSVYFRGIYKGKSASTYSEIFDEENAILMVNNAFEIAKIIENDDEIVLCDGKQNYKNDLKLYNEIIDTISVKEKINIALDYEKKALENEKISKVFTSNIGDGKNYTRIVNSKGLDISSKTNGAYYSIYLGAKDSNGYNYTKYESDWFNSLKELEDKKIYDKAVKKVLQKIGQKSIRSGNYKCILHKEAFNSIFSVFISNLSASSIQKGFSILKNKINKKVTSEIINIKEDPHNEKSPNASIFDGEGYPTIKKIIVENGILKTYYHNLKTAKKDNIKSTGNSSKLGQGIMTFNTYMENGHISYDSLIKYMKNGIIIDEFTGLNSGIDYLSGDFSLSCSGFFVENSKILYPISQIIMTDNVFEIMNRIQNIADDRKEDESNPSVFIENVNILGD